MALITLRHGTASAWTTANPVLAAGEVGVETDTNKTKSGDGSTVWSGLPYTGSNTAPVTSVAGRTGAITLTYADVPGSKTLVIYYTGSAWPARTTVTADRTLLVWWVGPLPGPTIGTASSTAVQGLDLLVATG